MKLTMGCLCCARVLENIGVGMKIETYNYDCDLPYKLCILDSTATVMKIIYGLCIS